MTDTRLDVLAIGNAIVDVIAGADDAFIEREGLSKGGMQLIDAARAGVSKRTPCARMSWAKTAPS